MYAVEFETVAQNGVIQIPANYSEFMSQPVKVVLMMDDTVTQRKIANLQALVSEGIASGVSSETMESIQKRAMSQFNTILTAG
jgi:hypothetical protein